MSPGPSLQQLASVAEEFAKVRQVFASLDAKVTDAEWAMRPSPDSWSVAECIAHLNLSSAAMLPRVRAAYEEARKLSPVSDRKYKGTMLGRFLARVVGPAPVVMGFVMGKSKTPPPFVPGSDLPRAAVAEEFRRWSTEEAALVREAETLQVDRVLLESPFVNGAMYDGYSSLWIVARHELRHLDQAERALARIRSKK
jgi:hypothetical protein